MLQRYAAIAEGNAVPTVIRKDMCWFASQRRNADTVMAMDVFIVDIPAGRMCSPPGTLSAACAGVDRFIHEKKAKYFSFMTVDALPYTLDTRSGTAIQ